MGSHRLKVHRLIETDFICYGFIPITIAAGRFYLASDTYAPVVGSDCRNVVVLVAAHIKAAPFVKHRAPYVPTDFQFMSVDFDTVVGHVNLKNAAADTHAVHTLAPLAITQAFDIIAAQACAEQTVIVFSKTAAVETILHGADSGTGYALRHGVCGLAGFEIIVDYVHCHALASITPV